MNNNNIIPIFIELKSFWNNIYWNKKIENILITKIQ